MTGKHWNELTELEKFALVGQGLLLQNRGVGDGRAMVYSIGGRCFDKALRIKADFLPDSIDALVSIHHCEQCPDCKVEMDLKSSWVAPSGIWQCPRCKNIVVKEGQGDAASKTK